MTVSKQLLEAYIYSQRVISLTYGRGKEGVIESQNACDEMCSVKQWEQENNGRMVSTVERTKTQLQTEVAKQISPYAIRWKST